MKFKSWKRVFSGILAAVTVISSCTAGPVMAAAEETETGYPTLQEVINQLDEDDHHRTQVFNQLCKRRIRSVLCADHRDKFLIGFLIHHHCCRK